MSPFSRENLSPCHLSVHSVIHSRAITECPEHGRHSSGHRTRSTNCQPSGHPHSSARTQTRNSLNNGKTRLMCKGVIRAAKGLKQGDTGGKEGVQLRKILEGRRSGLMESLEQRRCAVWPWVERTPLLLCGARTGEVEVFCPPGPGRILNAQEKSTDNPTVSALPKIQPL